MSTNESGLTDLEQEKVNLAKPFRSLAIIFIVAGDIGWFASASLLIERVKSLQNPTKDLACDISPFVACGPLFDRWQASLFGFPNAMLGVAGFIVPIVIGFAIFAGAKFNGWFWRGEDPRLLGFRRERMARLLAADLNLYAYHLPLDAHAQLGNNAGLARALGFTEKTVEVVLLPDASLTTVRVGSTVADVEEVCAATGYSRFPVRADDGGHTGYVHIKDVLETDDELRSRRVSADRVRVAIADEGPGFDPGSVPDCTSDERLEAPSGRGVMLMRSFMTTIEYNAAGNAVVLEKVREPAES